MTADQFMQTLAANGLDDDVKLTGFIQKAGLLVRRETLAAAMAKARADQQTASGNAEAACQAIAQQIADTNAALAAS